MTGWIERGKKKEGDRETDTQHYYHDYDHHCYDYYSYYLSALVQGKSKCFIIYIIL